jgi:hypothetical protein
MLLAAAPQSASEAETYKLEIERLERVAAERSTQLERVSEELELLRITNSDLVAQGQRFLEAAEHLRSLNQRPALYDRIQALLNTMMQPHIFRFTTLWMQLPLHIKTRGRSFFLRLASTRIGSHNKNRFSVKLH